MARTLVIAHRTCPLQAAENSLEGIGVSAQLGADGVEIDLRQSLDQRSFLMHDWTMRRTTGWPLPLELTPSAVVGERRLSNGEPVPSLESVFPALSPDLLLAVDVKTPWAVVPLVSQVRRRGLDQRVLVWCQSALAVRYAVKRLPSAEVAYLKDVMDAEGKRRFIAKAVSLGARAISAHWHAIDRPFVDAAHAMGLKVYSFSQDFDLTPDKLSAGLDGIVTDYVAETRGALERSTAI